MLSKTVEIVIESTKDVSLSVTYKIPRNKLKDETWKLTSTSYSFFDIKGWNKLQKFILWWPSDLIV